MSDEREGNGERLVRLGEEDKRKLYGLLDADLPTRVRRIEFGVFGLFVLFGGDRVVELAGGPSPVASLLRLVL